MSELESQESTETALPDLQKQVVIVQANGQHYGLPIDSILEVLETQVQCRIPGAGDPLVGVVNHAGSIFAVVDLIRLLSVETSQTAGSFIVLLHSEQRIGLRVDKVLEITHLDDQTLAHAWGGALHASIPFADRSLNLRGQTIPVFNREKLLETITQSLRSR